VLSYGVQFASLSALITHTGFWHGSDIWQQSKKSLAEDRDQGNSVYQHVDQGVKRFSTQTLERSANTGNSTAEPDSSASMTGEDVHCRLMGRYEDAPMTWYLATFVAMLAKVLRLSFWSGLELSTNQMVLRAVTGRGVRTKRWSLENTSDKLNER